ncbi:HAD-IC family P-type ATPase [Blastococcus sp. CCUG 61487]|uniref:HAD-IC family P-type ATPase n=1 Tax=Blastococcus sp. CCUG 61487 TaxID=1840703 RepID=UPI0032E50CD1
MGPCPCRRRRRWIHRCDRCPGCATCSRRTAWCWRQSSPWWSSAASRSPGTTRSRACWAAASPSRWPRTPPSAWCGTCCAAGGGSTSWRSPRSSAPSRSASTSPPSSSSSCSPAGRRWRSTRRAGRELRALLDRAPQIAHRRDPVTGEFEDLPIDRVRPGDRLLVRPSEVVPVDGMLLSDVAEFDESSLTGESLPVSRTAGDELLSGSINGGSAVEMTATAGADESQYQRIVALVAEAGQREAPLVRVADRYAVPFTLVSFLIGGVAWALSGDAVRFAEVLVLATPCPLLIAAPVAFLAGMGASSRSGIIVRGGDVVERLARVETVAFDKTGTLTYGRPTLTGVRTTGSYPEDEVLRRAASAEQYSTHALAPSVIEAARARDLPLAPGEQAAEYATNGVVVRLPDGEVVVGKRRFVAERTGPIEAVPLGSGELAVYVGVDGAYAGALIMRDELRSDAVATIDRLHELGSATR